MIKLNTIGMYDIAKIEPTLTSTSNVNNYSFLVVGDITYLILNDTNGDDSYKEDIAIKAGECLNGYDVSAWNNKKLVIDEKHIAYASQKDYSDLVVENLATSTDGTMLKVASSGGKLEVTDTAPTSGVYFVVTDKVTLTEKAIKVRVVVVDKDTVSG